MFRDFCPLSHELTVPKFGTRFSWLRTAPMSGEEGPSPLKSFLEPLNLTRGEKYGDRHGLPFPPCPASHTADPMVWSST